jgi:hypothetical protein
MLLRRWYRRHLSQPSVRASLRIDPAGLVKGPPGRSANGSVEGQVVQVRREMRDGFSEMKLLIREGDEATRNELRTEMRALNE